MKQDEKINQQNSQMPVVQTMRYSIASMICTQNLSRTEFIPYVQLGDPVWDLLLRIYTAKHFDRSTQPSSLAEQARLSIAVVKRCLDYLLEQEAVFENTNQYSREQLPYLVSEETMADIDSWIDNCFANLQSGFGDAISATD